MPLGNFLGLIFVTAKMEKVGITAKVKREVSCSHQLRCRGKYTWKRAFASKVGVGVVYFLWSNTSTEVHEATLSSLQRAGNALYVP